MKTQIVITKYDYLKTPKYKWTYYNESGGSFTNSGEFISLKKCGEHIRQNLIGRGVSLETPLLIVSIDSFNESGEPIRSVGEVTYFFRKFGA